VVTSKVWEGTRFSGGRRAKRTKARALRAEFSERSRLRKTVIKLTEFSDYSYNKILPLLV